MVGGFLFACLFVCWLHVSYACLILFIVYPFQPIQQTPNQIQKTEGTLLLSVCLSVCLSCKDAYVYETHIEFTPNPCGDDLVCYEHTRCMRNMNVLIGNIAL